MIKFYGYNDARAIAAYNKRNLTKMFFIFALICIVISIVAIAISLYELLYVWGVLAFLLLLVLFAISFAKYDEKILKEKGVKTKHLFVIKEFKLFKDGKEVKESENINFYLYKNYVFLILKKSYYYIPKDELKISVDELDKRLKEVIFKTSIEKIIQETKEYIDENYFKGDFIFTNDTIIWKIGIYKFKFYIDYYETIVFHEILRFNKYYVNHTHYHIDNVNLKKTIKKIDDKWNK